jgi:hypothetical protein
VLRCDRAHRVGDRGRLLEQDDLFIELDHAGKLHRRIAVFDLQFGKMLLQRLVENHVGFIEAELGVGEAVFLQHRAEDVLHQPVDQRFLLDDRDRVGFLDPRHRAVDAVALAARAKHNRIMALDQQRPVECGGLAGDQLRAQIGEVAAVLVLPHQEGIEAGFLALLVGFGDALAAQRLQVDAAFVADVEGSARKAIHEAYSLTE